MSESKPPIVDSDKNKSGHTGRRCIWLALFFPISMLFICLIVAAIIFTNSGLKLVVWGAEKVIPSLYIEEVQGSLLPEFTLREISYHDKTQLDVELTKLHVSLKPSCFFQLKVCVNDISIDGLMLSLPKLVEEPSAKVDTPAVQNLFATPIPINITDINLNNVSLNILGNHVDWRTFHAGISFIHSELNISPVLWQNVSLELASNDHVEPTIDQPLDDETISNIYLPSIYIPLKINLEQFSLQDFSLQQATVINVNQLNLMATASEHDVNIKDLYLDMPEASLTLNNQIKLDGDYPLTLEALLKVKETDFKGQQLRLKAEGSVVDLMASLELSGGLQANISARVQPLEPELPFDINITKADVHWPLIGQPMISAQIANLTAKGDLEKYQFASSLYIEGENIPSSNIHLKGQGNTDLVNINELVINSLGGSATGKVEINWRSLLQWKGSLVASNIQPGTYWSQAEGSISGQIATNGSVTESGGWIVNLTKIDINGVLRSYPLKIDGSAVIHDEKGDGEVNVNIPNLQLHHGNNKIELSGKINNQVNINSKIHIVKLSNSVPDLYGKLLGTVTLTGKLLEPKVTLNIEASNLNWMNQARLKKASIDGYFIAVPKINSNLKISLIKGKYNNLELDALNATLSGNEKQHQLNIKIDSNIASTDLLIDGTLDRNRNWRGELLKTSITTEMGRWQLDRNIALAYNIKQSEAFVGVNCWLQDVTSICLNKDVEIGRLTQIDLSMNRFELKKLDRFIAKDTQVVGEASLHVIAKLVAKKAPEVKASLYLPQGSINQTAELPIVLAWDKVKVEARLQDNIVNANWLVAFTNNGQLDGQIRISDLANQKMLKGRSTITDFSLSMFQPMLGEFSQLQGEINSDINFSGPILKPKLFGQLAVDDILLKGSGFPIDINKGDINISLNGYEGSLASKIATPDGDLNINGHADWKDLANWQVIAGVNGNNLQVNVPPIVKLKVNPNMQIRIIPTLATITGTITIPWGRIVVDQLPQSAVSVSKDQVILNNELQPVEIQTQLPMKVETDIQVIIGRDVQLSAFGLEAALVGQLNVAEKENNPYITGDVNIEDGTYRSFGQDLQIKKGKILFNGPADQPYLDIEAIRNPENTQDDVVAGVKVDGPASAPRVIIFSTPSMPQANALSYLLRGQNIGVGSGNGAMTTTLIGLSLARSGKVVGEIGRAFGVRDLHLDTAGFGDESQVTISGYIAPNLQVKYGVGIFNSLGEFSLRYKIASDFYVETVTGINSAVEFIYQFSFD